MAWSPNNELPGKRTTVKRPLPLLLYFLSTITAPAWAANDSRDWAAGQPLDLTVPLEVMTETSPYKADPPIDRIDRRVVYQGLDVTEQRPGHPRELPYGAGYEARLGGRGHGHGRRH
jgi:hypothetical protein